MMKILVSALAALLLAPVAHAQPVGPVQHSELPSSACATALTYNPAAAPPFGCNGSSGGNATKVALNANQLIFGPAQVLQYFDPAPPGLVDFTADLTAGSNVTTVSGEGALTIGSGSASGTVTNGGLAMRSTAAGIAVPNVFTQVQINSISCTSPATCGAYVGLQNTGGADSIYTVYNNVSTPTLGVFIFVGSTQYTICSINHTLTLPAKIAFSLVGNSGSAWYNEGSSENQWVNACEGSITQYDFTLASNIATSWAPVFSFASFPNAGSANVSVFTSGRFGGVGMRDIQAVLNQDGSIFSGDGLGTDQIYFTATACDPLGSCYMGVFILNLDTLTITETGAIFSSRAGHLYTDVAGQVIAYTSGERKLLLSSWATGTPTAVLYADVTAGSQPDILTANGSAVPVAALSLPLNGGAESYDPSMIYDGSASLWRIAYTDCLSGYAVCSPAEATSPDLSTWTLVGEDTSTGQSWEGTRIALVNGAYSVLASGPFLALNNAIPAANTMRTYAATSMTYNGQLHAVVVGGCVSGSAGFPPHAAIFPHPNGYQEVLLTFNGAGITSGNCDTIGQPVIAIAPLFGVQ